MSSVCSLANGYLCVCTVGTHCTVRIFWVPCECHIRIRIRIRIILFWIYKYGTISVTIIYINKHDSRLNPGNRYKDICRGTSVTVRLPGQ